MMQGNSSWIIHRGQAWDWAGLPCSWTGSASVARNSRPAKLDGAVIAVFALALVGVVVFGGLLMLLSWATAALPSTAQATCPRIEECVSPPLAVNPAVWVETSRFAEPTEIP